MSPTTALADRILPIMGGGYPAHERGRRYVRSRGRRLPVVLGRQPDTIISFGSRSKPAHRYLVRVRRLVRCDDLPVVDVAVAVEDDGSGQRQACAKIASDEWELNVRAPVAEFVRLVDVRQAQWNVRGSIRLGESAGAPVFWAAADDGHVTAMVGQDDEAWDFAVRLSGETVDLIAAGAQALL